MGEVLDINDQLSVEVRRESFRIYDEDQQLVHVESPEFHYRRVFPLKAALEQIIEHPRFIAWLAKQEGRR